METARATPAAAKPIKPMRFFFILAPPTVFDVGHGRAKRAYRIQGLITRNHLNVDVGSVAGADRR